MSAPTFHAGVSLSSGMWLAGLLAFMVALISVGGWLQVNNQKVETRRLAVERLDYIAALKSEQIDQWMHERRADADLLGELPQGDAAAALEKLL